MAAILGSQAAKTQVAISYARGGAVAGPAIRHLDSSEPELARRSLRKRSLDAPDRRGIGSQQRSGSLGIAAEMAEKREEVENNTDCATRRVRGDRVRKILDDDFGKNLGAWRSLGVSADELRLDLTLPTGQSFRWKKTGDAEYTGVIGRFLVSLRQGDRDVFFLVHPSQSKTVAKSEVSHNRRDNSSRQLSAPDERNAEAIIRDYLNLETSLKDLWASFQGADERFAAVAPYMAGARLLRQDPLECVFQFICSSNNHIQRISTMVDYLASLGPYLGTVNGTQFHQFPALEQLGCVEEMTLREAGFGYRAKFIVGAAEALRCKDGGIEWLFSLRKLPLKDAIAALCTLPGVGPKVAACIALFSLDQHHAIPVDTHVWQIAVRYLTPELAGERLTPKLHVEVADAFVRKFGKYAGWAHTVLFIAELSSQQNLLPEQLRVVKVKVKRKAKAKAKASAKGCSN